MHRSSGTGAGCGREPCHGADVQRIAIKSRERTSCDAARFVTVFSGEKQAERATRLKRSARMLARRGPCPHTCHRRGTAWAMTCDIRDVSDQVGREQRGRVQRGGIGARGRRDICSQHEPGCDSANGVTPDHLGEVPRNISGVNSSSE